MPKAATPPIRTDASDGHRYPVMPSTGKRALGREGADNTAPSSTSEPVLCRGGCGRMRNPDGSWA